MHIDWWTLALQTVNVLVLVWLLARFFFKPVATIIAERQKSAEKLLADGEAARLAADKAREEARQMQAAVAAKRDALIAEAQKAAEGERATLLERTHDAIARLRSEANAAIDRDRAAAETALLDRAATLSVSIAERLLRRLPPAAALAAFLDGLCAEIRAEPAETRSAFIAAANGSGPITVVTATPLEPADRERTSAAIADAFGAKLPLTFTSDASLIAGIELTSAHAAIRNSWKDDLERIRKDLSRDSEQPGPVRRLAGESQGVGRVDRPQTGH